MNNDNANTPAFPVEARDWPGISKREYFAAMALQGELAASANSSQHPEPSAVAGYAVACADALIAALED